MKSILAQVSLMFMFIGCMVTKRAIIVYRVKTLYEYRGTREDDLCFKEDEVIKAYPHKDSHSDWWYGTSLLTNQSGFFPRTYVEVVDQGMCGCV